MDLGSLKVGSYIIIDNEPCRIVSYDHSKPGKHGSAKARVSAISVFDGSKHSLVSPVETFEMFETSSVEYDIREKVSQGADVEYWKVLERVKIVRVKS